MTIARPPLEDGATPASANQPGRKGPPSPSRDSGPSAVVERPDVPLWGLLAGVFLVVVFAGLVVQTYSGHSIVSRLAALAPGSSTEMLTDADSARALYVPGSTVQVGQVGIGSRGQDRAF